METQELIRSAEYKLLCRAVTEACGLQGEGKADAGYRCLHAGLDRALEYAADGMPWGAELAEAYATALSDYVRLRTSTQRTPLSRPGRYTPG